MPKNIGYYSGFFKELLSGNGSNKAEYDGDFKHNEIHGIGTYK